ncbi:MAG: bifunctional diaminohydroxyphosphoribosylaminopyrimidine deaminase/5-amino-6-(5-phosphoribosylamino)uracil reductase RibD [Myxococcota bacterium]
MSEPDDRTWMRRALALSARALGTTAPNPPVGALIVRGGEVLGEGFTQPVGRDHAEVVAIADCVRRGHDPAGATLVVTLEPCCHHGRTPPCVDAITAAGLSRVVVGALDPYPPMRGRGVAQLRERGVAVEVGVEHDACARRILGFARAVGYGLPEVTLKAAVSADGRIATATGESKWITSPEARAAGHGLRATHDAVLVGVQTVLADDPALTARLPGAEAHQPVPVVLDTELRLPDGAQLLAGGRALVVCAEDAPARTLSAEVIRVPRGPDGRTDPEAALRALAARGLHRVLVEGGGQVHRSLLDRGLADALELFVAPVLIPGGVPFVGGPRIEALGDAVRMTLEATERVGPDAWLRFRLRHGLVPDPHEGLR